MGLAHIRWVGGGTGAGKSTVTRRLADRYGLAVYGTDTTIGSHSGRLDAGAAPRLAQFRDLTMDERWVRRDPATMYRTFPWFHGEGFDLLLEDLRALPTDTVTVVEGFRLLPELVQPHVCDQRHAAWLLPTPRFRREAFTARKGTEAFWLRTSDPERAFANLLERDALFTSDVASDAARHGLRTLAVDGTETVEETVQALAEQFGLAR